MSITFKEVREFSRIPEIAKIFEMILVPKTRQTILSLLKVDIMINSLSPSNDREYFEFNGGNVFSWSTKNADEEYKKCLYEMIVFNVIRGYLVPKQRLPEQYHNLILAEAIKGNRNNSIIKYMELK